MNPSRRPGLAAPTARTEYRKPRRINSVSITLACLLALSVYVMVALWPVYTLRASVKGELADALPQLYRLNLRPAATTRVELVKLKKTVQERIAKVGVKDKKLVVNFIRDKKRVKIEARFAVTARWPGLKKTRVFNLAPSASTDAARVEWE